MCLDVALDCATIGRLRNEEEAEDEQWIKKTVNWGWIAGLRDAIF